MLGFGLFATDQSHEETLSLCASDSVKLFVATLLVHRLVHLEQVYIGGKPSGTLPVPASSPTCIVGEVGVHFFQVDGLPTRSTVPIPSAECPGSRDGV